jgi:small subunit ribosomal protein S13
VAKEKTEATPEEKPEATDADAKESDDFKYIVRVANTDLDGNRSLVYALTGLKGVGTRIAEIIADNLDLPRSMRIGDMTDEQVDELVEMIEDIGSIAPPWLLNRRRDCETGEDIHLIGTEVDSFLRDDINRMRMIRCYRGVRHEQGQKVRGQRTRSNGRTGLTVGVMKKAARLAAKKQG